jgi:hypothetical protein
MVFSTATAMPSLRGFKHHVHFASRITQSLALAS